ncbi:hypothetical protein [Sebaldella sp. S0638]|uniref:hypothetical protein n=1 Tax=Sebaldella sp. S0638 TaxID=2957809 RepID=UPI00209F691E|nr:hypothetical protein [Sebaldella sp. S0638]MCP1225420.1 hypothetical protein [Sebaldella sp. S0638]
MNKKESFYEYMYNYEYDEYYEFSEEIVNPIVEIIRRYDNFQKEEEKKYKAMIQAEKLKKHKFIIVLAVYAVLFMGVSIFKMNALYEIVDLNLELGDLNAKIFETQKVVNSLEYRDKLVDSDVSMRKVVNESKKMGFTEDRKVEYVHFVK